VSDKNDVDSNQFQQRKNNARGTEFVPYLWEEIEDK
jgi:hypothetical protein